MSVVDAAVLDRRSYVEGVRNGDRGIVARAITLVESTLPADQALAHEVLADLMPHAGRAHRIGITGAPGVGKSTFIEAFGSHLTGAGRRVAVLAVDPTSTRSGGSILGDKTRMTDLSRDPEAFVRPSPSGGTLGGVARRTREAITVCEAAGYDVVLVETVGVGQSELVVANMVDFFVVLMLARGGDDLQGIKRGVLELADLLAVTKADGDNVQAAKLAQKQYEGAMRLMQLRSEHWTPPVLTCSARDGTGISEIWDHSLAHRRALEASGEWSSHRRQQGLHWLHESLQDGLMGLLRDDAAASTKLAECEAAVLAGTLTPDAAAAAVLRAFRNEDG